MKLATLVNPKFQATLRKLNASELPAKTAFKLKGISRIVQEELDKYEDVRQKSLNTHGSRDEDGNLIINEDGSVKLSEEAIKAFVLELNELANEEVAVPSLSVKDLGEKLTLSADDLFVLDSLVSE